MIKLGEDNETQIYLLLINKHKRLYLKPSPFTTSHRHHRYTELKLPPLYNIYKTTACPDNMATFIKNITDDKIFDNIYVPKSDQCIVS